MLEWLVMQNGMFGSAINVPELSFTESELDRLADLLADRVAARVTPTVTPPAYTIKTLAAELGRSERSIRSAIARGELHAVKRGRGWVISAEAVADWAYSEPPSTTPHGGRRRPRLTRSGPMRRALTR